jgi:periplasmic divalent cation tolerance protein
MDKRTEAPRVLLSTAPSLEAARTLAASLLDARLAACVQLLPGLESHYVWEGKRECAPEVLLLIKTNAACLRPIEALFASQHPYQVPELLELAPSFVEAKYLAWLRQVLVPGADR